MWFDVFEVRSGSTVIRTRSRGLAEYVCLLCGWLDYCPQGEGWL